MASSDSRSRRRRPTSRRRRRRLRLRRPFLRLRRYLRLDEDGDDDGLDLFGEEELEGVGDPGER